MSLPKPVSRRGRRPSPPPLGNKENAASVVPVPLQGSDELDAPSGRGARTIIPTARIDPVTASHFRPGHVQARASPMHTSLDARADNDDDGDATWQDQHIQAGLIDDDDDGTYLDRLANDTQRRMRPSDDAFSSITYGHSEQVLSASVPVPSLSSTVAAQPIRSTARTPSYDNLFPRDSEILSNMGIPQLNPAFALSPVHTTPHTAPYTHTPYTTPHTPFMYPPHPSPLAGRKRSRTLSEAEKLSRKKGYNDKRYRLSTFSNDPVYHASLAKVMALAKCHFATRDPYPSVNSKNTTIASLFAAEASSPEQNPNQKPLDDRTITMISREEFNVRSEIYKAAHALVPKQYGLVAKPRDKSERLKNATLATFLKTNSRFLYQEIDMETETLDGLYLNKVISDTIEAVFFQNENSLGCRFPSYFNPVTDELLALVYTAIRFDLQCWESGQYTKPKQSRFSSAEFENYDKYMEALARMKDMAVWQHYRVELYDNLRELALPKVDDSNGAAHAPIIALPSDDDILAALEARMAVSKAQLTGTGHQLDDTLDNPSDAHASTSSSIAGGSSEVQSG
ncbi:hypothetical protein FA95DRAFT_1609824 [Auriscalpium vulgare]|uniref:Uncharacterized protein n=1 Tax=Auriscalpium vulgare TaxID=40419 RepID=A0ACB8RFV7_9AGAM|nr:hypothetical protein FA95DRAFT_1609824 [Auriscalpium vulgare]